MTRGTLIVADNVLFKGLVLNSDRANKSSSSSSKNNKKHMQQKKQNYWKQRWQGIADELHAFSAHVNMDPRTEVVLLPVRDGLTLIRVL